MDSYFFTKCSFIRKIFYFFQTHFMFLIQKNFFSFDLHEYLVFLKGLNYCTKETKSLAISQIGKDDDKTIERLRVFLINFEGFFYKLTAPIMTNVEVLLTKLIEDKCKDYSFETFNIATILTINLKEINDFLTDSSEVYLAKIQKLVLIKILEKFIQFARNAGSYIIEQNLLRPKVKEMRSFIQSLSVVRYVNFNKFLIHYVKFIETENDEKAKNYLGMMANMLGQRISDQCILDMIYTKPGDFFGLMRIKFRMYFWDLTEEQSKGEKKLELIQKRKQRTKSYTCLWKCVIKLSFLLSSIRKIRSDVRKKGNVFLSEIGSQIELGV